MNNDTAYAVRVRGRNARGDGPWAYMPVSVSNLGQTKTATEVVGRDAGWGIYSQAAGFTTGANSSGYTLQSVTVKMANTVGSPTGLTVAIHASSGGNPAASATYTLTGPNPPLPNAQNTYSCAGTCSLAGSAEYFLVLSATVPELGENHYKTELTSSDDETNTPADAGWSIANAVKYSDNGGDWTDSDSSSTLLFEVAATAR